MEDVTKEILRTDARFCCLIIRGATRLTGKALQKCIKQFLKGNALRQGEQSISQLTRHGAKLESLEITDANIKSFEHVARKYGIDFALKRDAASPEPVYFVFFKSRDVEVMQRAFQEYSQKKLIEKPSLTAKLEKYKTRVASLKQTLNRERSRAPEIPKEPSL